MKKIVIVFLGALLSLSAIAQAPQKFSYQSVVRGSNNALVVNQVVGMQISILQGSATGTPVFVETHTPTSNANGLVCVEIGGGNLVSGSLSSINWANGTYFIKTETDPNGGTAYSITGTTQLLSVPYALYAKAADTLTGNITETDPIFSASVAAGIGTTDTAYWNSKLNSFTETDPIYSASVAAGIGTSDTTYWNNKLDAEIDGSVTNELQTINRTGLTVTLSNGGGSYTDSVNVYSAGNGIDITNNVISANSNSILPPGIIMPYAGASSSVPQGWLLCDGSAINRTTYANLFSVIGVFYGVGNTTTTFNLPDMRGRFLRGVDNGAGNDPDASSRAATNGGNSGDNVGSIQNDEIKSHNHSMGFHNSTSGLPNNYPTIAGYNSTVNNAVINGVSNAGGSESRPKNINVNYIIKF